jgi:hypothetical protein
LPPVKNEVRNYLRSIGREDAWTAMQGVVYGQRMVEARAFPGVVDFMRAMKEAGVPLYISSHRTKHPIVGEQYDLHAAARDWVRVHGVGDIIPPECIFFEVSKEEKRERIRAIGPTHFIDDLPEFLTMPGFPEDVNRILFNPQNLTKVPEGILSLASWDEIRKHLAP